LLKITDSNSTNLDKATESKRGNIFHFSEAIELAKQLLKHNKSAKIYLARFLSGFYNTQVKIEDLN
jgi:hypothetical protein